ncbi:MAG: histidine phosphatase family protein [Betaproteobacteria bacterium]|nr:MAG: histidine phosphatase family protein [Betaproteobacteria bacterium]
MRASVFIIRHGDYDRRPSIQGTEASCDFGLSALGVTQAQALRDRLTRTSEIQADALFCSTLPRARQTAEIIAPALGVLAQSLTELCEWESGNEVLGVDPLMKRFHELTPEQRRHHRFHPGFETIAEFTDRVQAKMDELVKLYDEKTVVMVVHGGVVEAAFHYFLGFGPGPFAGGYPAAGHTSITHWRRSKHREDWVQEFANDMHHLRHLA